MRRTAAFPFEFRLKVVKLHLEYYNYKRPHQGIGGLSPADRFFEIETALKKTLEQGVEENALAMALRGDCGSLNYRVQQIQPAERMFHKSIKIRQRLGADTGGILAPFPDKPLNMHWQTYYRMQDVARKAEAAGWEKWQRTN